MEKILIAAISKINGLDLPIAIGIVFIGLILIKGKKSGETPSEIGVISIAVITVLLIASRLALTWWPNPM